jgi:hypothetical protein
MKLDFRRVVGVGNRGTEDFSMRVFKRGTGDEDDSFIFAFKAVDGFATEFFEPWGAILIV